MDSAPRRASRRLLPAALVAVAACYVGRRPGFYRFLFEVAYDSLGQRLVPETARASPPFEVRP